MPEATPNITSRKEELTAEQKAEAEKRKTENEAFAYHYQVAQGKKLSWYRLDDPDFNEYAQAKAYEQAREKERKEGTGFSIETVDTKLRVFPNGVYRSTDDRFEGFDLRIENGQVSAIPPPKQGDLNDCRLKFEAMLDMLAVGKQSRCVTIDWGDPKYVDLDQLNAMLKLAEEKSLYVEFGPNVKNYMASNLAYEKMPIMGYDRTYKIDNHGERREHYYNELRRLKEKSDAKVQSSEYKDSAKRYELDRYESKLSSHEKLKPEEISNDNNEQKFKPKDDHPYKKIKANDRDKRVEFIGKEVDKINDRLNILRSAKDHVQLDLDDFRGRLNNDQASAFEIGTQMNTHKNERAKLMTAMDNEIKDLEKRNAYWQNELNAVGAPAENSPAKEKDAFTDLKTKAERIGQGIQTLSAPNGFADNNPDLGERINALKSADMNSIETLKAVDAGLSNIARDVARPSQSPSLNRT